MPPVPLDPVRWAEVMELFSIPATIEFEPADIFDKFGFGDGDMLDPLLDAWAVAHRIVPVDNDDISLYPYVDRHVFLFEAYRRLVAPEVSPPIEVMLVGTIHNPVSTTQEYDPPPTLTPETVPVATERLFALADELFPPDPLVVRLVLLLHMGVEPAGPDDEGDARIVETTPDLLTHPTELRKGLLERAHAVLADYSPEEIAIASSLLGDGDLTPYSALAAARRVLEG